MRKGRIDPDGTDYNNVTMVVDCELLFEVKRKWTTKKKFVLNDFNRKVLQFIRENESAFDRIVFICVGDYDFRRFVFTKILSLNYQLIDIGSEENFSSWIKMLQPEIHLAVQNRRYYSKRSVFVTEDFLQDNPA